MTYIYDYLVGIALLITGSIFSIIFNKYKNHKPKRLEKWQLKFCLNMSMILFVAATSYYSFKLGKGELSTFNFFFLISIALMGFFNISILIENFVKNNDK